MHHASTRFWQCYSVLAEDIQQTADRAYELLKVDPQHPSLHFKRVGQFWSVRVGRSHRALGIEVDDGILWFWIGDHAEYDRLIRSG